jgi:hypothetical protein
MFEEAPNIKSNPLPNHASDHGSVNTLEADNPRGLKVSLIEYIKYQQKSDTKRLVVKRD